MSNPEVVAFIKKHLKHNNAGHWSLFGATIYVRPAKHPDEHYVGRCYKTLNNYSIGSNKQWPIYIRVIEADQRTGELLQCIPGYLKVRTVEREPVTRKHLMKALGICASGDTVGNIEAFTLDGFSEVSNAEFDAFANV